MAKRKRWSDPAVSQMIRDLVRQDCPWVFAAKAQPTPESTPDVPPQEDR
jgi:hypothetical protein